MDYNILNSFSANQPKLPRDIEFKKAWYDIVFSHTRNRSNYVSSKWINVSYRYPSFSKYKRIFHENFFFKNRKKATTITKEIFGNSTFHIMLFMLKRIESPIGNLMMTSYA